MSLPSGSTGVLTSVSLFCWGPTSAFLCWTMSTKHLSDQSRWLWSSSVSQRGQKVSYCSTEAPLNASLCSAVASECFTWVTLSSLSMWPRGHIVPFRSIQETLECFPFNLESSKSLPFSPGCSKTAFLCSAMMSEHLSIWPRASKWLFLHPRDLLSPFYFDPRASKCLSIYTTGLDVFQKWFPSVFLCVQGPLSVLHSVQRSLHAFLFNR